MSSAQVPQASRHSTRVVGSLLLVLLGSLLLSGAAPEKYLSVYSVAANYSLPIMQRDGRDYIGLLEVLEPLGKVSAKAEGSRWRLRYNDIEGDFQQGKNRARIQGRDVDLGARFYLQNDRGVVPLSSLNFLLPRFLGGPVTLHAETSRLFIGSAGTHFTATLSGNDHLIFNFTASVDPKIATEPGVLRMTFSRDPLVGPASPMLTFGSKSISSASYTESNGEAIVTVHTTIPVIAGFSNDGRTITISPAPSAAQNAAPSSAPSPTAPPPPSALPAGPATAIARRYFAVVDASHGGDDHGEALSSTLVEKDVTLALARSLRRELESRGITTLLLRDSDVNLLPDQRAAVADADHAAIYVALHASSDGHGVRVYTALLPYEADDRGPFHAWSTAQHNSLTISQAGAAAVVAELQKRQIPVRTLLAPLRPLNNVTGAAIAIEVAPQGSDVTQLVAPDYQQLVTSAVATAIAATRDKLGAAP